MLGQTTLIRDGSMPKTISDKFLKDICDAVIKSDATAHVKDMLTNMIMPYFLLILIILFIIVAMLIVIVWKLFNMHNKKVRQF